MASPVVVDSELEPAFFFFLPYHAVYAVYYTVYIGVVSDGLLFTGEEGKIGLTLATQTLCRTVAFVIISMALQDQSGLTEGKEPHRHREAAVSACSLFQIWWQWSTQFHHDRGSESATARGAPLHVRAMARRLVTHSEGTMNKAGIWNSHSAQAAKTTQILATIRTVLDFK